MQLNEPFDLFGNRPHLSVIATRNDDQGIKGVNQLSAVQDSGIEANLLGCADHGRFEQFVGRDGYRPSG